MIQIKSVKKAYIKGNDIIKGIDLEIKDGEIFGFLGPNGVGKTTIIKMITGILNIDQGDILIDNYSITRQPVEAKKRFSYVPDDPNIFLELKGIEYLNFIADMYEITKQERKEKITLYATIFDLTNNLNQKIASYSHGMKQKLIIIGSLLSNTNNWIIDEPMTGLDPKSTFELKKIMRQKANQKNCVFFSTHILDIAEKICDRIGIINNGKILYVGTIDEIRGKLEKDKSLEEFYLEITKYDK